MNAEDILQKAIDIKRKKSADYQGSRWTEEDYFPFGDVSFLHMIHTKYLRIRSVAEQEQSNFESLDDSLVDMINYCAMYGAWLHNQKFKENLADDLGGYDGSQDASEFVS